MPTTTILICPLASWHENYARHVHQAHRPHTLYLARNTTSIIFHNLQYHACVVFYGLVKTSTCLVVSKIMPQYNYSDDALTGIEKECLLQFLINKILHGRNLLSEGLTQWHTLKHGVLCLNSTSFPEERMWCCEVYNLLEEAGKNERQLRERRMGVTLQRCRVSMYRHGNCVIVWLSSYYVWQVVCIQLENPKCIRWWHDTRLHNQTRQITDNNS